MVDVYAEVVSILPFVFHMEVLAYTPFEVCSNLVFSACDKQVVYLYCDINLVIVVCVDACII